MLRTVSGTEQMPSTDNILLFYSPSLCLLPSSQLAGEPPEGRAVADSLLCLQHPDTHTGSNKYLLNSNGFREFI